MIGSKRLSLAVAGVAILLAACQDGTGPVGPAMGSGPAFSQAAGQAGGPDRHALARAIPGFGGIYFENGQPTVALVDPGQRPQAERVLAAFLNGQGFSQAQLQVRQAAFDYESLEGWFEQFWGEAFAQGGVVMADLNETRNAIVIGVENAASAPQVRALAARFGIPASALVVEQMEPIVPLATLQQAGNPITGGLQIHFGNYLCTLGFLALSGAEESFITNSHCTNTQGGTEGTQYYQPLSSIDPTVIGVEVNDPQYFRGGVCPRGARCRYSDSSRARRLSSRNFARGLIARTTGVNTGSLTIDPNNPTFTIDAEYSQPSVGTGCAMEGTTINKVGRTTGWTQGRIVNTCVNVGVQGSNIVQLYQVIVQAGVGSGDSGSPAFEITSNGNVMLHGILWGGGSSTFVYSPIANIESELGPLTVTSGGGGPTPTAPAAPGNLSATAVSSSQINLSWTDLSNNEDNFEVRRSLSSGSGYSTIALPDANSTSFSDTNLAANTTYYYRVAACNAVGCSTFVQTSATTQDSPPPSGSTVRVADLDGSVNIKGKSGKWEAFVTVTVVDENGSPVSNATVSGTWTGDATGQVSATTDSNGMVTIGTGNINSGSSVTFTVTNVSASGFTYDPTANGPDPDGDSTGTMITINQNG